MVRSRTTAFVGGTAATVLGVSLMIYVLTVDHAAVAQSGASTDAVATGAEQPVAVETGPPQNRPYVRELALPATLEAWESVDLFAKTSGYVSHVNVDIGDRVKQGDMLIRLDVPEMADELRQADAELASRRSTLEAQRAKASAAALMVDTAAADVSARQADVELQRVTAARKEELFEGAAIPQQDLDEARSRLHVAEAQLKIAKAKHVAAEGEQRAAEADVAVADAEVGVAEARVTRLKTLMAYATITAPFDGMVTRRQVDHGDFVRSAAQGASPPLLTLAHIDRLRMTLHIPESDCRFVHPGTPVNVRLPALGDGDQTLTITRTAHALEPDTRTMRAEADVENIEGTLSPGMYAHAVVQLEARQTAMFVPSKAVRVRGEEVFVLVAESGTARSRTIQTGYDDGQWAEVVSGLSGDEAVIVAARGVLAPGMAVGAADRVGSQDSAAAGSEP